MGRTCDISEPVQKRTQRRKIAERPAKRRDRQVVRILGILGTLLEGGQPTIKQLATRFGTCRETIYRDIRAIEAAGYPVAGDETGRLSQLRLLPEARRHTPQVRFSDAEINALLWASRQRGVESAFAVGLASGAGKLRALASDNGAPVAAGIGKVVTESGGGAKDYASHAETILKLVETIVSHRQCEVEYQAPARRAAKTYRYEPYRILTAASGLYCIGRVPPHENLTTLAVDRIRNLRVTDQLFKVNPAFDIARYTRESFGVIWEEPIDFTVRFSADQAPYVRERQWHPTQRIRELSDGRIDLTFQAGGVFEIMRWVLGWGDSAEIIRPTSMRREIRRVLLAAAGLYGTGKRGKSVRRGTM